MNSLRAMLLVAGLLLAAAACQLATEDFESQDWFEPYADGADVPGTEFCYDYYSILCYKLKQCYPESMYQEQSNEQCASKYFDEYCQAGIYESQTVKGEVANACFEAMADWSCTEVDRYLQTGDVPTTCESPFAN